MTTPRFDQELQACLERASVGHRRLCPRQVLGVRMGMLAGVVLGLPLPQQEKRLFSFVETDGCMVDGVVAATGCTVGRRTMRIVDFGKVAATFVDTLTGEAIRIRPHPQAREHARVWAPSDVDDWHAMIEGYRHLPADKILQVQPATLLVSMAALIGRPGLRVPCSMCGEEIMNAREVAVSGQVRCRGCAGDAYTDVLDLATGTTTWSSTPVQALASLTDVPAQHPRADRPSGAMRTGA